MIFYLTIEFSGISQNMGFQIFSSGTFTIKYRKFKKFQVFSPLNDSKYDYRSLFEPIKTYNKEKFINSTAKFGEVDEK